MNINRLLTRREKEGSPHRREKSRDNSADRKLSLSRSVRSLSAAFSKPYGKSKPLLSTSYSTAHATSANSRPGFNLQSKITSADGISALFRNDREKKAEELDNLIQRIKRRLHNEFGFDNLTDGEVNWALSSLYANGNAEKACEYLVLFRRSAEGKIVRHNPAVHMLGAENRFYATCYMDTLLFSMFESQPYFEPLLYQAFHDEPRKRLSTLLRFWVNMLRTGRLIRTDVTAEIQDALVACGWNHPPDQQQDVSEFYGFITDQFRMPLLTLKMDIYHHGAEDATDDHKFIHERLLEVAVPERSAAGEMVKLEDCLETFLNNRVEVYRHLDRSNSKSSAWSHDSCSDEKGGAQHIEASEISWSAPQSPLSGYGPTSPFPGDSGRHRSTSIFKHRVLRDDEKGHMASTVNEVGEVIRKEVSMPAWQFFTVMTGESKNAPTSDAEVAAHFSQEKPFLGICLKRYGMSEHGDPVKRETPIDIPLDIGLPHFIEDGAEPQDFPLAGNFKLSLRSVICHKGMSLHSGHYVVYNRRTRPVADGDSASNYVLRDAGHPPRYPEDEWVKFDDMQETGRVTVADIQDALAKDGYLLFYQIIPLYDDSNSEITDALPPSYDSGIYIEASHTSAESDVDDHYLRPAGYFDGVTDLDTAPKIRFSAEIERPRQSLNIPEERRGSLAHTETTVASAASSIRPVEAMSAPATPSEETTAQRMSRAAARFTKSGNKSRPNSAVGENRISATFSRLNLMRSKDQLNKIDLPKDAAGNGDKKEEHPVAGASESSTATKSEDEIKVQRAKSKKDKKKDKQMALDNAAQHEQQKQAKRNSGRILRWPNPDRQCNGM